MGIGTSLGAFYRDEGHYSASIWQPEKYDDNDIVVTPNQMDTNKQLDAAEVSPSGPGMPINNVVEAPYSGPNLGPLQGVDLSSGNKLDYKQASEFYNAVGNHELPVNTPYNAMHLPFINKLLGINGEERHQLWPERMINELTETAGKVAKGDVPMWTMDPETGEMHTSLDAMQSAWKMMAGANSGTITKVLDKVSQNPPTSRSMSSIDVQEENIRNWMHDTYPPRGNDTRDSIRDFDNLIASARRENESIPRNYSEQLSLPSDRMRHAEQLRQERTIPGEPSQSRYVGFTDEEWASYNSITRSNRFPLRYNEDGSYSPEVHRTPAQARDNLNTVFRQDVENTRDMGLPLRSDAVPQLLREQGKIKLMTNPTGRGAYSGGGQHMFFFTNDKGAIGKVDVSILDSGKTLYVHGIKGVGNDRAPGTFGTSDMKDLVRALRKEFPDTKGIKGFRISGARQKAAQDRGDFTFRGRDASGTLTDSTRPDLSE